MSDRLRSEVEFHDRQAAERAESFRSGQAELRFNDAAYLDHETWISPGFAKLGPLRGRRVLDYGCGHGMAAVVLARAGARVAAMDVSPGYVSETQARATANGVAVECRVGAGEALPYPDEAFDAVWGSAVLHHVDLTRASAELYRVLVPGGRGVFCEPWGGNPLLTLARDRLPYPGKNRTPDEKPLTRRDLIPLRECFPDLEVEGYQLLAMAGRFVRSARLTRFLAHLDRPVLTLIPPAHNWCRYAVIRVQKKHPRQDVSPPPAGYV